MSGYDWEIGMVDQFIGLVSLCTTILVASVVSTHRAEPGEKETQTVAEQNREFWVAEEVPSASTISQSLL